MTREKKLDELEVSDQETGKVIDRLKLAQGDGKLAKSREELLTPRGKAEAIVVDSLDAAAEFLPRLLSQPLTGSPAEMAAQAAHAKTQFAAAVYIIDSAKGIAHPKDKRVQQPTSIASHAMTHALAQRLAQRNRPRIVEAAIPAIAEDDVDARSANVIQSDDVSATHAATDASSTVDTRVDAPADTVKGEGSGLGG